MCSVDGLAPQQGWEPFTVAFMKAAIHYPSQCQNVVSSDTDKVECVAESLEQLWLAQFATEGINTSVGYLAFGDQVEQHYPK